MWRLPLKPTNDVYKQVLKAINTGYSLNLSIGFCSERLGKVQHSPVRTHRHCTVPWQRKGSQHGNSGFRRTAGLSRFEFQPWPDGGVPREQIFLACRLSLKPSPVDRVPGRPGPRRRAKHGSLCPRLQAVLRRSGGQLPLGCQTCNPTVAARHVAVQWRHLCVSYSSLVSMSKAAETFWVGLH